MYNYKWNLKDAAFTKDKGTVFSCFACGGVVRWGTSWRKGFTVNGWIKLNQIKRIWKI